MPAFALCDANAFYCSCERVFNPRLALTPLVVLSNNDGCIVARTSEVKALGIPMGQPWFQVRARAESHGVKALSSNYALYADMSQRFMAVLGQFSPDLEVYSIDEAFLLLDGLGNGDLAAYGRTIRARVLQWTGLPICVGIAPTKTLAKLANHVAKRHPDYAGVCDLRLIPARDLDRLLAALPATDVWGIGPRLGARLAAIGITTALSLREAPAKRLRAAFSVMLERTVLELNGVSCLDLEEVTPKRRQIVVSRSFGLAVTDKAGLREAVTTYATRAAEKLRRQASVAGRVMVFIHTNYFSATAPPYAASVTVPLADPSADTRRIVAAVLLGLDAGYRDGHRYVKAGVMLLDLRDREVQQGSLWPATPVMAARSARLMTVLDGVNRRMGRDAMIFAGAGVVKPWRMRQQRVSPRYTTRWSDLPVVSA